MTRYADPTRCPDCGSTLPASPAACPACGLPLTGPVAVELYETLVAADRLLGRLRVEGAAPVPAPDTAPDTAPAVDVAREAGDPAAGRRRGLSGASVPTILLGLGALCLLVAAVTFLAVAWSWLGVGGRTAVLVGLTVATGGAGVWLAGRGLRTAAESLTVVALGLLALDVLGADNAGWLGDLSASGLTLVVGGTVTVASVALTLLEGRALVAPQVTAGVALTVAAAGAVDLVHVAGPADHAAHAVMVAAVVASTGLAHLGRSRRLRVLPYAGLAGAALWWLALVGSGLFEAGADGTARGLWLELLAWPLVAATALLAAPAVLLRAHPRAAGACAAGAAVLATVTVALPALDDSATTVATAALVALVSWSLALVVVPRPWKAVPTAPMLLAALQAAAITLALTAQAATNVLRTGEPATRPAGVRLAVEEPLADPLLVVPLVVALLGAGLAVAGEGSSRRLAARPAAPAAAVALAVVVTLALYAVPLAAVVGLLSATAAGLAAAALRGRTAGGTRHAAAAGVLVLLAVVAALPSDWLTTAALAVAVVLAAAVWACGRFPRAQEGAEVALPAAVAGLVWSASMVADLDPAFRAAPVFLVVGSLAVLRPRPTVEVTAGAAALIAGAVAVPAAADGSVSLALHLTLAGTLVTASSLIHRSRRLLAWPGGLLLAMATWVRLADLGVDEPEAYTLPSAVVLVLVGLRHLWMHPGASSRTALAPGLALATVPSLLVVLVDDPVSLRALLLGAGCLALVLAGSRLHWSAPLVVGAAVGGLLVLRELAPYARETPQWVLIGLAGTALTVVGTTWEHRMRELHHAAAYLTRLR